MPSSEESRTPCPGLGESSQPHELTFRPPLTSGCQVQAVVTMAEDADAGLLLALNLQDFLSTKLSLSTARPEQSPRPALCGVHS